MGKFKLIFQFIVVLVIINFLVFILYAEYSKISSSPEPNFIEDLPDWDESNVFYESNNVRSDLLHLEFGSPEVPKCHVFFVWFGPIPPLTECVLRRTLEMFPNGLICLLTSKELVVHRRVINIIPDLSKAVKKINCSHRYQDWVDERRNQNANLMVSHLSDLLRVTYSQVLPAAYMDADIFLFRKFYIPFGGVYFDWNPYQYFVPGFMNISGSRLAIWAGKEQCERKDGQVWGSVGPLIFSLNPDDMRKEYPGIQIRDAYPDLCFYWSTRAGVDVKTMEGVAAVTYMKGKNNKCIGFHWGSMAGLLYDNKPRKETLLYAVLEHFGYGDTSKCEFEKKPVSGSGIPPPDLRFSEESSMKKFL